MKSSTKAQCSGAKQTDAKQPGQLRVQRNVWGTVAGALCLMLISFAQPSNAKTSDFEQPIDVKANRSEFDEKAGVQSLIGNVRITQGTMRITADRITVSLQDNKLSVIKGEGSPITFRQENDAGEVVTGECSRITYDAANGRLTLEGDATLSEPKQNLRSEKIIFDSITQTVVAEGGDSGQVSITIQPPEQNK